MRSSHDGADSLPSSPPRLWPDAAPSAGSCTKAGTIAVTILAGPLNYMGVNPKVNCTVPQPSK
jgi:hypothetical protein